MRFKIFAKNEHGINTVHYFDNVSLDIENEDGIPVYLKDDPRCSRLLTTYTKDIAENKPKAKDGIFGVRITLGFNCNFHCKYCHERAYAEKNKRTIPIHVSTDEKANRLVDRLLSNLPNLQSITFWGGEPLVYLKTMKKIVALVKERKPDMVFSTITNGSLLTLSVAKWLYENKIGVTISHDGPSFNAYRDDLDPLDNAKVLEGILYLFQKAEEDNEPKMLPRFNIVVTPDNCDLQVFDDFFKKKLGRSVPFNFESIVKLDEESKSVVRAFDEASTKKLLNNIVAFGSTETNTHQWSCLRDTVTHVMQRLVSRSEIPSISCFVANSSFIPVDMDGNVLICHGAPQYYCSIEDVNKVNFHIQHTWMDREDCTKCPFLVSCMGGCQLANDADHKIACENLKIWHSGFFIAAWKLLFGATIYRIEPIMEQ